MTVAIENLASRPSRFSFEAIRLGCVSAIFISSFFVKFEPAICDLLSFATLLLFARSGLYIARSFATPLLFMFIYILGTFVSAIIIDHPSSPLDPLDPLGYAFITAYISVTAILLACFIAADPQRRYLQIEKAWWIGATIGSILGLAIYFGFKPIISLVSSVGATPVLGYTFRVIGGYKDPNVFSTWLVLPVVSMVQAFALKRLRIGFMSLSSFLINVLALLLAFSRGAWFDLAVGSALAIGLTILLTPSLRQRQQVMFLGLGGIFATVLLLLALLDVPSFQAAFADRFVLVKSYDGGETGRFGHQLNSLPLLLRLPMGFGPYQFQTLFGEAPHNTFLNSFATGGWLGGISYFLWILTNFYMAIKVVFTRSSVQAFAIPVTCSYVIMTLQGFQIDNEHWRHLFWMMGIIWGLFAAMQLERSKGENPDLILEGWNLTPKAQREG